jgi:hypothetical protein
VSSLGACSRGGEKLNKLRGRGGRGAEIPRHEEFFTPLVYARRGLRTFSPAIDASLSRADTLGRTDKTPTESRSAGPPVLGLVPGPER